LQGFSYLAPLNEVGIFNAMSWWSWCFSKRAQRKSYLGREQPKRAVETRCYPWNYYTCMAFETFGATINQRLDCWKIRWAIFLVLFLAENGDRREISCVSQNPFENHYTVLDLTWKENVSQKWLRKTCSHVSYLKLQYGVTSRSWRQWTQAPKRGYLHWGHTNKTADNRVDITASFKWIQAQDNDLKIFIKRNVLVFNLAEVGNHCHTLHPLHNPCSSNLWLWFSYILHPAVHCRKISAWSWKQNSLPPKFVLCYQFHRLKDEHYVVVVAGGGGGGGVVGEEYIRHIWQWTTELDTKDRWDLESSFWEI